MHLDATSAKETVNHGVGFWGCIFFFTFLRGQVAFSPSSGGWSQLWLFCKSGEVSFTKTFPTPPDSFCVMRFLHQNPGLFVDTPCQSCDLNFSFFKKPSFAPPMNHLEAAYQNIQMHNSMFCEYATSIIWGIKYSGWLPCLMRRVDLNWYFSTKHTWFRSHTWRWPQGMDGQEWGELRGLREAGLVRQYVVRQGLGPDVGGRPGERLAKEYCFFFFDHSWKQPMNTFWI